MGPERNVIQEGELVVITYVHFCPSRHTDMASFVVHESGFLLNGGIFPLKNRNITQSMRKFLHCPP